MYSQVCLKITIQLDHGIVLTFKIVKIRNGTLEISNHRSSRNFEFYLIFYLIFYKLKILLSVLKVIGLLRILKITIFFLNFNFSTFIREKEEIK